MGDITPVVEGMLVRDVLKAKGSQVHTVRPEQGIEEAIQILARHSVGSLLVVDGAGRLVGVLSERDVLRAVAKRFDRLGGTKVSELMTDRVLIGLLDDSLDYVMGLMTAKRIRHLPILAEGKLAGILSIGDIVKAKGKHAEVVARYLADYISGQYPA